MSRAERIIAALEGARFVRAAQLAGLLGVSRRTLKAELDSLQQELGTSALIMSDGGRLRLAVADPRRFQAVRNSLAQDRSFNDPALRGSYIVGRLFRSAGPVTIDELAAELAVGRSTINADLVSARQLAAEVGVQVAGRTNVGLTLVGDEVSIRTHVLRDHYPVAYPGEPWQVAVTEIVNSLALEAGLERTLAAELTRWSCVAVDRTRTGHGISHLPERYEGLAHTQAHEFARAVATRLSEHTSVQLSDHETVFLTLPIAGMRAPANSEVAKRFGGDSRAFTVEVFELIRRRMGIDLAGSQFAGEFTRHIDYLVNRLRYGIWIDDAVAIGMAHEFPVAFEMATLAADLLEQQTGMVVNLAEKDLLATYFQLFLDAPRPDRRRHLELVVVYGTGRVTAELVRLQLAKLLPPGSEISILPADEARREKLDGVDLVVLCGQTAVETSAPTVVVTQAADLDLLKRQLARSPLHVPLDDASRSIIAAVLDRRNFFALPPGTGYLDALEYLVGHLHAKGLVDDGFGQRLLERERQATMQFTAELAFPHATVVGCDEALLAVACIPRAFDEPGPKLIVLLGVPEDASRSEVALLQVYDAVLRLAERPDVLTRLSQSESFEDFYYTLENNAVIERNQ